MLHISIISDLDNPCCGRLLEDRPFSGELFELVMFVRLFKADNLKIQVTHCLMRIDSVIMIGEL